MAYGLRGFHSLLVSGYGEAEASAPNVRRRKLINFCAIAAIHCQIFWRMRRRLLEHGVHVDFGAPNLDNKILGGGFKDLFYFHPYNLGEWNPFWRAFFSTGLVKSHQLAKGTVFSSRMICCQLECRQDWGYFSYELLLLCACPQLFFFWKKGGSGWWQILKGKDGKLIWLLKEWNSHESQPCFFLFKFPFCVCFLFCSSRFVTCGISQSAT